MKLACFRRQTVWWPTWLGWCCLLVPPMTLLGFWLLSGESFLSVTRRVAADTLVVEGWVGIEVLPDAILEFDNGGYERLVLTGGLSGHTWSKNRWSLTEVAEKELLRLGFPGDKLLLAPCEDSENHRTYLSALAAKRMIEAQGLHPKAINVVSRGVHSRRTGLVYAQVFGPAMPVGIISWRPYATPGKAWWRSSERAKELLDESFGFIYERLLSSGREGVPTVRLLALLIICLVPILILRRVRRRATTASRPSDC